MSKKIDFDLIIYGLNELVTLKEGGPVRIGSQMQELSIIKDGAIACDSATGHITFIGTTDEAKDLLEEDVKKIHAKGKIALPGFVDPHTHLVFAGFRDNEFMQRAKGATYQEIHAQGGGILSTVSATRQVSKRELVRLALPRLEKMLQHGTTTVEVKSGYGLTTSSEMKILEIINDLNDSSIEVVPTFLGAHTVAPEYKDCSDDYVELIIEDMFPVVRNLAYFCDVYCEKGAFNINQTRKILTVARELNFGLRLHADEFSDSGCASLAAELGAKSADHLLFVSQKGINDLAKAKTVATLLPGTSFFINERFAPARDIIDAGVPVALATDFNAGSSLTLSMQMVISLACLKLKMTPEEAITAATVNSAYSLDLSLRVGTLEVEKQADFILLDVPTYKHLPYYFGTNMVSTVVKKGKIVKKIKN